MEIECKNDLDFARLKDFKSSYFVYCLGHACIKSGLYPKNISFVEQNCGTPESINQKALDLLNKAAETIACLSDKLSDSSAYALGLDIEEYIRNNTKG